MKLHLGCGKNIKSGYVNIDGYVDLPDVQKLDVLNLPYDDGSIDEVLAEHFVEHIPFKDEERFWNECVRLLKKGGKLTVEVPDMEWLCKQFLEAEDSFKEFYKVGAAEHYFGNGKSIEHRWSIITTHFFGNQNGGGQFHYNGYTKQKLIRIGEMMGFSDCKVAKILNKGAQALVAHYTK